MLLCLIKLFPLVALHLDFYRPSYGYFAKIGRVNFSPGNSGQNGFGQFSDFTWASNFIWLETFLVLVFLMKVVVLYLIFPMTQKSGHLDLSRGSYSQIMFIWSIFWVQCLDFQIEIVDWSRFG